MSITSFRVEGIVFNTVGSGDTLADFLAFIEQNVHDWTDCQVLWDMNQLDFTHVTSQEIRNVVTRGSTVAPQRAGLKTAFVVESDLGFGMMRMFQMFAEQRTEINFSVFRNSAEAIPWLKE